MRPKRCRGWEELLYQMERREIKMHRGVEKRFDRRAVGRSTTSGAGAASAETRAVVGVCLNICADCGEQFLRCPLSRCALGGSPQRVLRSIVHIFLIVNKSHIKKTQTINDNTDEKCLWLKSDMAPTFVAHTKLREGKSSVAVHFCTNSHLSNDFNTAKLTNVLKSSAIQKAFVWHCYLKDQCVTFDEI